ncbi:MAG TPA: carbohydrate-binding family 9-like protein [Flavihumibacter sp.]|nr:carbohydrate-binding family 9-like protein [Bacteroidota bacterium]HOA38400.1 carbohydrate-binding family 9-like protein [Flavihumibacter sp.]HPZ87047.1 carbohydrate-binding family 9-like protein [Flavihumibacter sp.]HQD09648.1 carbohydrate-binding family 9-like protein [Flavihumibacter sp.]
MKKRLLIFALCPLFLFGQTANEPRQCDVNFVNTPIKIDGQVDEAWESVSWSPDFVDIVSSSQPMPPYRTRIKLLWDHSYLYLLADMEEPHIWATLKKHDDIVFHDNDFELFIDPNNDGLQYFEIEVNPFNTVFDLLMNKPYNKGGNMDASWNSVGFQSAVVIDGTLNKPTDTDKGWLVEMAIPFASMKRPGRVHQPQVGDSWRANFSRVEWDTDIVDGKYIIRRNASGKKLPEHNWVWSPQGAINMHIPEKWGYIHFKAAK